MESAAAYDVFLSHNGADKHAVECLAHRLKQEGFVPFLDRWNLVPGQPWQEALEEVLSQCASCAVVLGPEAFSPWHHEELRAALELRLRGEPG
jgi:hypothetical protein